MGSDEARLEELLKSMMNGESGNTSGSVMSGLDALKALQDDNEEASSLDQIFDFSESSELDFSSMPDEEDMTNSDFGDDELNLADLMRPQASDEEETSEDMPSLSDMLESMDSMESMEPMGEMDISDLMAPDTEDSLEETELDYSGAENINADMDLMSLFGNSGSEDLADIQEMLDKSDNHELIEETPQSDMEDLFNLFAMDNMESTSEDEPEEIEETSQKPKKERKKLFGKRKKKKEKEQEHANDNDAQAEETATEEIVEADSGDIDIFGMEREAIAQEEEKVSKKKRKSGKGGFFNKMGEGLFGEDDADEQEIAKEAISLSDENAEVLEQLSEEDASKKSKKDKKNKKKGTKSKNEEVSANEDGNGNEEEVEEKAPKKKKAKKPKREKKVKEYQEEKPTKKLSKKKIRSVVLVCATLVAIIMLLKIIGLPMLEMTEARDAYFVGDYKKAYELFVGDELKASDQILMEKATIIVKLSHAVETYENHLKMGKKLEALDDLMQGVAYYSELEANEKIEYITSEATTEYQKILERLDAEFGLSQEDAKTILGEEDLYVYNLQLQDIVDGKPYVRPGEEPEVIQEEKIVLEDMLPEEEEYLNGSNN